LLDLASLHRNSQPPSLAGKYIFVSDFENGRVLRFDHATKAFKDVFVAKGAGGLKGPWGIAFNKFDDPTQPRTMLVSSKGTNAVLQYDACDGTFVKKFATIPSPHGLKFTTLLSKHKPPRNQKMLLAASHYSGTVRKYNALTGSPLGTYAVVRRPMDIVLGSDAAGPAPPPPAPLALWEEIVFPAPKTTCINQNRPYGQSSPDITTVQQCLNHCLANYPQTTHSDFWADAVWCNCNVLTCGTLCPSRTGPTYNGITTHQRIAPCSSVSPPPPPTSTPTGAAGAAGIFVTSDDAVMQFNKAR
jgi:hypothetical protein